MYEQNFHVTLELILFDQTKKFDGHIDEYITQEIITGKNHTKGLAFYGVQTDWGSSGPVLFFVGCTGIGTLENERGFLIDTSEDKTCHGQNKW